MSYPIFPDKFKLPAMLTAKLMVDFRIQQGSLKGVQAPETVILCLYKGIMHRFLFKYPSRQVSGFLGDLYLLNKSKGRIGVLGNFGIGAPVAASMAEEMIAWGVKHLVLLSLAGGLQPDLVPGSVVVCNQAVRDEGTSYHYLPPTKLIEADPSLIDRLSKALSQNGLDHKIGGTWSTDAPYRETKEEATQFQKEGILAVDMESAGLFAVGRMHQIRTASVFVIGDSLAAPRWSAPPNMAELHRVLKSVFRVLTMAL